MLKTLNPPTNEQLNVVRSNLLNFYPEVEEGDAILNHLIMKVWDDVLIYCHLIDMPEDLLGTVEDMVLDNLLTYRWFDKREDIDNGRIKEITEGDVSIKKLTDDEARRINASLKGKEVSYLYKLNAYRRNKS